MKEVLEFLKANPVQYAATVGLDGKPKVRPFQFMLEEEGKLWFCTNSGKNVYKELAANPALEFCVASAESAWLRLSGRAVFVDEPRIKEAVMETSPLVKSIYKDAFNPVFEVFYLEGAEARIFDFSGKPPKCFML